MAKIDASTAKLQSLIVRANGPSIAASATNKLCCEEAAVLDGVGPQDDDPESAPHRSAWMYKARSDLMKERFDCTPIWTRAKDAGFWLLLFAHWVSHANSSSIIYSQRSSATPSYANLEVHERPSAHVQAAFSPRPSNYFTKLGATVKRYWISHLHAAFAIRLQKGSLERSCAALTRNHFPTPHHVGTTL